MKRLVILGHSGFVGKHLFSFFTKKYPALEIVGLSSQDVNLTDKKEIQKLKNYFDQDTVVIMTSGIKSNYGNDLTTFQKNIAMAENVCQILATHRVKRFLFFSSIAVYGVDSHNAAITEKTAVIADTYYGLSKYVSEQLLELEFSKQKESSLIIMRTPTIYGPDETIKAPTPSGFLMTYLDGDEITLWGDGSDRREFLYVDDLVNAIDKLITSDFKGTINIGDGVGHSYKEALNIISTLLGKELIVHTKERSKPKVDKVYDNSLFRRLFPAFSFTSLENGLQLIRDSYQPQNKLSNAKKCLLCQQQNVSTLLDLGLQPLSNRFVQDAAAAENKFPLQFGQCHSCGLAQLTQPMPAEELTPSYDWITYLEPEEHLDSLAATIKNLNLHSNSKILGVSFKDKSLLDRLARLGFNACHILDVDDDLDLGKDSNNSGVEKIQSSLTVDKARQIVQKYGLFDVVIARHIMEHAYDLNGFIAALKELMAADGYLVIEVPDCGHAFEKNEYPIIWEEHLSYFTPTTFRHALQHHGLNIVYNENVPYALENSLIAIGQKEIPNLSPKQFFMASELLDQEKERVNIFAANFKLHQELISDYLSLINKNNGRIALLGAGHLACAFINYFDLKKYIDCVIDDHHQKAGLLMPGSLLPIYNSAMFLERDIKTCLLSVNQRSENSVMEKNKTFRENGGRFLSIFANSKNALPPLREINSLEKKNEEVFIARDAVVKITPSSVNFVRRKALHNPRRRARICFHQDSNNPIHEMLIALTNDCYIRPHKHNNKSESFHVIDGEIEVILFDDDGNIKEKIDLGDYNSGKKFYYRLSDSSYHTVIIKSAVAVFHETTNGPFKKEETIYAPWSPEEGDAERIQTFKDKLMTFLD